MAKASTIFVCSNCGNEFAAWQGLCGVCGQWNTLKEIRISKAESQTDYPTTEPSLITTLAEAKTELYVRLGTGLGELDRVLGGGVVPGSIGLIGGDPGIGKSTLLLHLAGEVAGVLYVSGEESREQTALRAKRLGVKAQAIHFVAETDVRQIIKLVAERSNSVKLLVIDSIQTMFDPSFPSTPGSLVQVRETALAFQRFAKSSNVPVMLVGHVTKDGQIAGPRILEHMVDYVLYLEGDRYHGTRVLRGVKNRFGPTDEIGVFAMAEQGLRQITNPSELFLSERQARVSGSVVTAVVEGSRPFLVEVQALVTPASFGYPQRKATGFSLNRLQLLAAVLQKRAGLNTASLDIFVNIVGGVKLVEPAADLAVCLAISSALKAKPIEPKLCVFGEVGLTGEIRSVRQTKQRVTEAKRLGFEPVSQSVKRLDQAIKQYLI